MVSSGLGSLEERLAILIHEDQGRAAIGPNPDRRAISPVAIDEVDSCRLTPLAADGQGCLAIHPGQAKFGRALVPETQGGPFFLLSVAKTDDGRIVVNNGSCSENPAS